MFQPITAACRAKTAASHSIAAAVLAGLGLVIAAGCGPIASRGLNAEGTRLFDQGQYDQAIRQFDQAIAENPSDADAYYNLGATYHRMGTLNRQPSDMKQAEHYYRMCLEQAPDHRACYRGLAVLLAEQGQPEEAFKLIQGWADRSPSSPDPKIELARLYEEFGEKEKAKDHLLAALANDPNNARALAALGRLREQNGEYAQALNDYNHSLQSDRFQEGVQRRLAALRSTLNPAMSTTQPITTPPGGTRVVTGPTNPQR